MTTHILGDNVPRKSNFDPDLARKVTKYYEEHPEELNDKPQVPAEPTETAEQPTGKYILMPLSDSYALGVHALQERCVKEDNRNHPILYFFMDGRLVYRPLSFKENIQARVENYETIHNQNGSERTMDERLSLITERWNNSCTAIAYKAGTTKFKVVPISELLITLSPNFKEDFRQTDYNNTIGLELDSENGAYNANLKEEDVLNHPAWRAAVEGDKDLLKSYAKIIFTEFKRKYGLADGMGFWVQRNTHTDELRPLCLDNFGGGSYALGVNSLSDRSSFLRRDPSFVFPK